MRVQQSRVEKDMQALASFGALPGGGVTRLAFTPEDIAARRYVTDAMQATGLHVRADAFGNLLGRRPGREALPPVMIGSHLDTVPQGGNFDGVVGVVGALEVIRVLNDENRDTRRPVEVVNFSCEESSRFGAGTLGGKALAGKVDAATLKRLSDRHGVSLYEALGQAGYRPDELSTAAPHGAIHAFIELHIEQGPVLENRKLPIGIVTAIAAPTRFKVAIEGRADHSGNTPMALRRDALAGAAEIVLAVERIAAAQAGEKTVGTVGYLQVSPGVMNVVPGRVELGIDLRDIDAQSKRRAARAVLEQIAHIAARRGLQIVHEVLTDETPVALSPKIIACLEAAARRVNLEYVKMTSGAGHDAMHMAAVTDAAMIFIPSVNGISHNIAEFSRLEDICRGVELLLEATEHLARE